MNFFEDCDAPPIKKPSISGIEENDKEDSSEPEIPKLD